MHLCQGRAESGSTHPPLLNLQFYLLL